MKSLREQIVERVSNMGGEVPEYYKNYSDYDLLEDFENLIRTRVEEEFITKNIPDD